MADGLGRIPGKQLLLYLKLHVPDDAGPLDYRAPHLREGDTFE